MKLSINFTDQQYQELMELAAQSNKTITDVVIAHLPITKENKLELQEIEASVSNLSAGDFTIPELFTPEKWASFTKGSRLVTPKAFYKKVLNREIPGVTFLGKNSANLARYNKS